MRRMRLIVVAALAFTLLVANGALAATTLTNDEYSPCSTQGIKGVVSSAKHVKFTTFTGPNDSGTVRIAQNTDATIYADPGLLCNTQGGNAVSYRVDVSVTYTVYETGHNCTTGISISWPPGFTHSCTNSVQASH